MGKADHKHNIITIYIGTVQYVTYMHICTKYVATVCVYLYSL